MRSQFFCISLGLSATALLMMISTDARSQDASRNYIVSERFLDARTSVSSVQYYDAFGRPDELVAGGMNTSGRYLHTLTEYDAFGNGSRTWLPVVGSASPNPVGQSSFASESVSTYGDGSAFSDIRHDALGRVTFTSTPGRDWSDQGRGVTESHFTNGPGSVRLIALDSNGSPVLSGTAYYPSGSLFGSSVTDEDGHRMDVYRDVAGNRVLERRYDGGSVPNDTYYLYERGLLRAVVPMISLESGDPSYSYLYSYDAFGRCTRKILPASGITECWYDRYGRLSFLQDARLRDAQRYRFFLYDPQGRPAVQGLTESLIDSDSYDALVVSDPSSSGLAGCGYRQPGSQSVTGFSLETVNHYDGYACLDAPLFSSVRDQLAPSADAARYSQSQLTVQVVGDGSDSPLYRVLCYDWQGRCTESRSTYPENVMLQKRYRYSYSGLTTSESTSLYKSGRSLHTVTDSIGYHPGSGLPDAGYLSVDGSSFIPVSTTGYDDLGRIISRSGFGGSITEDYSHDISGRLTGHWAVSSADPSVSLFEEHLYYASGPGTPCYNGNISARTERVLGAGSDDGFTGYRYSYDGMDRLTAASFGSGANLDRPADTDLSERMEYNVDSSLKRLIRRGKSHTGPRTIDSLSYSYTRGRMTGLTERAATNRLSGSFEISRKGSFTYRYDTSGSLVGDSYRGISSVRYDMRGNPVFVAFDSGDETEYGYTTDGVKLWTIHRTVPGILSKETIEGPKEKVTAEINCEPLRSSLLSDSPSATGSSFAGTSLTGTPSGVSQSSGITGRQPKGASSNGTASSVASIESPVLKVSPAELSRLSNVLVQSVDVTRYYDSYEFDNASLTEGKFYFGGGYVSFHSGGAVEYSAIVSDYRGSTRVVLSAAGGPLQQSVQQLNGYYPSGALVADYQTSRLGGTSSADVQTRKFTGKELDRMHGLDWHDFGARRYDAAAVFFTSPDPLSEKYYHINPYVYCAGNPVNMVDPDGRDGVRIIDDANKSITIKATYFVRTAEKLFRCGDQICTLSGYSNKDIENMNQYNEQLNKHGYKISEGEYCGYAVSFDLSFVDGADLSPEKIIATYDNIDISNTVERGNKYTNRNLGFEEIDNVDGTTTVVGGVTANHKNVVMNAGTNYTDTRLNRIHEFFHTLGAEHPKKEGAPSGVMAYPPQMPSQQDINNLMTNTTLKTIIK